MIVLVERGVLGRHSGGGKDAAIPTPEAPLQARPSDSLCCHWGVALALGWWRENHHGVSLPQVLGQMTSP